MERLEVLAMEVFDSGSPGIPSEILKKMEIGLKIKVVSDLIDSLKAGGIK
jgi:hypothetical protein